MELLAELDLDDPVQSPEVLGVVLMMEVS